MINKYPYTDFHELNLDWILREIRGLEHSMSEFEAMNKITFDGAWDITKQYPAWCIVNDNGAGYISIQPVPAGMPLTNSDYWRGVVDYTATIADLQNRVVTLEGQMSTLNNSTIPTINTRLNILENRKYIMIGDSYDDADDRGTTGWSAQVASYLGLTPGVDYFKSSKASRGFIGDTSVPGDVTFLKLLNDLDTVIDDKDSITDIVVCGGCNDMTHAIADYDALCAAVATFVNTAHTKYQNAQVWIGMCGYEFNQTFCNNVNYLCYAYMSGIKNGANYMSGLEFVMHNSALGYGDGIHPNQDGENRIGEAVANNLLGCTYGVHYRSNVTVSPAAGWDLYTTANFTFCVDNDVIRFTSDNTVNFTKPGGFVLPDFDNYFVEIATFDMDYCWGNDNQNFSCTIPAFVNTLDSQRYPVSLTIAVREKKLAFIVVNMSGAAISNANAILIGRFNLTGDTLLN